MKVLYKPENETDAVAIGAMLEANSIHSVMSSFHDSAYAGVYQGQQGWGVIKVYESDYDAAGKLLISWKAASPDPRESQDGSEQKVSKVVTSQQSDKLFSYTPLLRPALLSLSILLNILLCIQYFSSKQYELKDYQQYDGNNILISRVEWGANKNNPYKYTYYLRNGNISSISFDSNDDGRTDKLINYVSNAKETYVDKDADGVYETCNISFDSGSHIEYKDHDQNEVFESSTITMRSGESYHMVFSNSNGFILMMTSPSGEAVSLDLLKKIACEL